MARVERSRIRRVKLLVEVDEPDGSISTYEVNGKVNENGGPFHIKPEYSRAPFAAADAPRVLLSVGVMFDALLVPVDKQVDDGSPLFRLTQGTQPEEPTVIRLDPKAAYEALEPGEGWQQPEQPEQAREREDGRS